jgi:hypothetical protein
MILYNLNTEEINHNHIIKSTLIINIMQCHVQITNKVSNHNNNSIKHSSHPAAESSQRCPDWRSERTTATRAARIECDD